MRPRNSTKLVWKASGLRSRCWQAPNSAAFRTISRRTPLWAREFLVEMRLKRLAWYMLNQRPHMEARKKSVSEMIVECEKQPVVVTNLAERDLVAGFVEHHPGRQIDRVGPIVNSLQSLDGSILACQPES